MQSVNSKGAVNHLGSHCFVLFSLFAIKINICKERTIHEHYECSRAVRQHGV